MKPTASTLNTPKHTETLPFVVRMAQQSELRDVAAFRAASYGKHLPDVARGLIDPEGSDYDLGCEVIVVRSKLDDSLLGTMRMHTNVFKPLPLQASIHLGDRFRQKRMMETTRLCIKGSPNASLVRTAMFKAQFHYCLENRIDWMLAAGRRPVDRIYESLLFADVLEPGRFYPMRHAGGIGHRVMCLSPREALKMWSVDHPLHVFIMGTDHGDMDMSAATPLNFPWICPEGECAPDSAGVAQDHAAPVSRYDYAQNPTLEAELFAPIRFNG
ncbi:N-acyl amino acid synthase FeeM domain-containing protein [Rhodoferax sp.]|jgi:hypothetical protein|uniref:N-acyl amino acid synthase FeeM domain-containing protein n=1 Tax=Rhodoferax sp. TaxID=50421 RepID=UPI003783A5F4